MKQFCCAMMIGFLMTTSGCTPEKKQVAGPSPLAAKMARYAPAPIGADISRLSEGDRKALIRLVKAAEVMDKLYLRQMWSGAEALTARLAADTTAAGKERYAYYLMNFGPWSQLDDGQAFIDSVPAKQPAGANYYPADMTKEEFTAWYNHLPEEVKGMATGFFTVIRRGTDNSLGIIPYEVEYHDLLVQAAKLLREAAELTDNASLKKFLRLRAMAFDRNEYYDSDVAWMDLDSPIEPTIGPYEVYMDGLFNYKAAFEAFICLRDDEETAKLARYSSHLQSIENHLPIDARYRNPKLGALAPIRVVDEVVTGGESRGGVQTAAFNLPNDEKITSERGSKRVMLKNVQEAKFNRILLPIAAQVIDSTQLPHVAFSPFFTHILAHELMHGLGPHAITVDGKKTTVRQSMRELGSAFEEAKADIAGLFALQYMIDHKIETGISEKQLYATYLAGIFRSVRFGLNEAHGQGMALQFNYLRKEGAILYNDATGRFSVDVPKCIAGARKLTGEIMTIQAEGSYEKAQAMLSTYAVMAPELKKALDRISALPVDITPVFTTTIE
jgi:hypothetical protein